MRHCGSPAKKISSRPCNITWFTRNVVDPGTLRVPPGSATPTKATVGGWKGREKDMVSLGLHPSIRPAICLSFIATVHAEACKPPQGLISQNALKEHHGTICDLEALSSDLFKPWHWNEKNERQKNDRQTSRQVMRGARHVCHDAGC